jgi:hypothetical protein
VTARRLSDVDAVLCDTSVDRAARGGRQRGPTDDDSVTKSDEPRRGEMVAIPLVPSRYTRLERRAAGGDALTEDPRDVRPVIAGESPDIDGITRLEQNIFP